MWCICINKLTDVQVQSCGKLLNMFPSCMLKRLQSLQVLKAGDCISLEEVYDVEGIDANANSNEGVID